MSVDEDQVAFDRREEYSAKSDNKSAKCCNREKFLLAFERRLHRLSIREVEREISKGLRVLRKHVERKRERERERNNEANIKAALLSLTRLSFTTERLFVPRVYDLLRHLYVGIGQGQSS